MNGLESAQARMRAAGVPAQAIDVFTAFYGQLQEGSSGLISESEVAPLVDIDKVSDLDFDEPTLRAAAAATVVVKLNGGLGTSMGMEQAKSILEVREGLTFLDIIVQQIRALRSRLGVQVPVVFMNSFRTRDDTLAGLARYPDLAVEGLPLDFLQNREPKLRVEDLTPIDWPANPELEWCPPGHADLYTALDSTGLLDDLLSRGLTYACVSNADNLGADPDPNMMAWFAASGAPYAAEVCRRTPADVKGGHIVVRRSDGRLLLRETAQVASEDVAAATDLSIHRYFHTNNLWIDLRALRAQLDAHEGVLDLPLIRNEKNVDPTDPNSPRVVQIESAMGAAIEVFAGAVAIEVDRSRFLPVKTTDDLALIRSDVYDVDEDFLVHQVAPQVPLVSLDRDYFTTIADFDKRLPYPLSLREARALTVVGDWSFGEGVVVRGDVELDTAVAQRVPAGTVLEGDPAGRWASNEASAGKLPAHVPQLTCHPN